MHFGRAANISCHIGVLFEVILAWWQVEVGLTYTNGTDACLGVSGEVN